MVANSYIKVTIAFNDPELDSEERESEAQYLLDYLKELDEVETIQRVIDPNPPEGSKAIGGILAGILMAEVNPSNCKKLLGFLGDRLGNKLIELEVEANGKKLKVKASSREELELAIKAAQEFIDI